MRPKRKTLEMRSGVFRGRTLAMGGSIGQTPKALEPLSMIKTDRP
jgi:hypothetical protein